MAIYSKRTYATCHASQFCCSQSPCPRHWPLLAPCASAEDTQPRIGRSGSVSGGSLGPGVHRFCLSPPSISDGNGFHFKCDFIPPANLLGLLFCPWTGVSFGRIHYSPVDGVQWLVATLEFLQEKMNTRPSTPPFRSSTQYVNKFGKFSSGHSTGKGQFSFQSQRKAMPSNVQTAAQLQSSHMLSK